MKFKTFRMLVIGGAVALVGTAVWQCRGRPEEQRAHDREVLGLDAPQPAPVASRVADVRPVAAAGSADVPALAGGPVAGHPSPEAYLLAILGKPADADKLKDVTSGVGAKINVYNEGGAWARAKVDHDRDEKWDEKWDFNSDGVVERQVAPADDEQYSETYRLVGGAWIKQ